MKIKIKTEFLKEQKHPILFLEIKTQYIYRRKAYLT
jgi:hypothetical protein